MTDRDERATAQERRSHRLGFLPLVGRWSRVCGLLVAFASCGRIGFDPLPGEAIGVGLDAGAADGGTPSPASGPAPDSAGPGESSQTPSNVGLDLDAGSMDQQPAPGQASSGASSAGAEPAPATTEDPGSAGAAPVGGSAGSPAVPSGAGASANDGAGGTDTGGSGGTGSGSGFGGSGSGAGGEGGANGGGGGSASAGGGSGDSGSGGSGGSGTGGTGGSGSGGAGAGGSAGVTGSGGGAGAGGTGGIGAGGGSAGTGGSGGAGSCVQTNDGFESCDGIDNDCDGVIDEDGCPSNCRGFEFGGTAYMLCDDLITWSEASAGCAAQGLLLVTIFGDADNEALRAAMFPGDGSMNGLYFWIGASRVTAADPFTWETGDPWGTYANWKNGVPGSAGTANCIQIDQAGQWLAGQCGQSKRSVCVLP